MKTLILTILLLISYSANSKELVVHEWGTFTSLMGSDGKEMKLSP
jgi:hypothetical protein